MNVMTDKVNSTELIFMDDQVISRAAASLKRGELVAIPTETVYGLAANGLDEVAVSNIFKAKGRPQDNPLILHIAEFRMLRQLTEGLSDTALALAKEFWPGPLTMILPKSELVPDIVTAGLDTVAVRMPQHEKTRSLIRRAGIPLAAPSANLSGKPSPTTAEHVYHDFCGKIPLILDGGSCTFGLESTVIQVSEGQVRLLRPGAITPSDLSRVVQGVEVDEAVFRPLKKNETASSPGMKYRHYAPEAKVILVEGSFSQFRQFVEQQPDDGKYVLVFSGEEAAFSDHVMTYGRTEAEQAKELFAVLRKIDDLDAKTVYVRAPSLNGIGLAVYNRLLRASAFEVIRLSGDRV